MPRLPARLMTVLAAALVVFIGGRAEANASRHDSRRSRGQPSAIARSNLSERRHRRNGLARDSSDLLALATADDETSMLLDQLEGGRALPQHRVRPTRTVESFDESYLQGAVQLPSHRGYEVRNPARAWGRRRTIDWLVQAFRAVVQTDPTAPQVRVHDLSLRAGGPMSEHLSHQTGRDVDITYYQRGCGGACPGREVSAAELDADREWRLLRYWLERGVVQFMFVDYSLQPPLYKAAQAAGATAEQLAEWFQYPRDPEVRAGIIRHVPGHANHVHVRFECPPGERCGTPRSQTIESDSQTRELWQLLGD